MGTGEEPLRRRFCRGAGCGVVFGSVVIVTGGTNTAASAAGGKRGGNNGGPPTGDTSKAGRDGSITATGNGPTGTAAAPA